MQTMNISLPDQLREFVEDQLGSGRYSSVSEYVRDLIRGDERRKAQEKLGAMLMEGIQSGESTEMTRKDWVDIRQEAAKQLKRASLANGPDGPCVRTQTPQGATS